MAGVAVVLLAFGAVQALGARADTIDGTLHYVALGDSYASGHGASTTYDDDACKRSPKAYSSIVFPKYGAVEQPSGASSLVSVACTGATIADVMAKQLPEVGATTRLVTLTAGGNDLDFSGVARTCVLSSSADCSLALNHLAGNVNEIRQPLDDLLRAIRKQALTANIVVSGYPLIFDTGACGAFAISEANRDRMRSLQTAVNQEIRDVARNNSVQFADPDQFFEDHRVCDSDHWINEVADAIVVGDPAAAYHPNENGQAAMAEAVFRAALGTGVN
jgi:lysophospholipase L1-like esterase